MHTRAFNYEVVQSLEFNNSGADSLLPRLGNVYICYSVLKPSSNLAHNSLHNSLFYVWSSNCSTGHLN